MIAVVSGSKKPDIRDIPLTGILYGLNSHGSSIIFPVDIRYAILYFDTIAGKMIYKGDHRICG